jgi:glycosyltransferase involved in cell wall biosynthesis
MILRKPVIATNQGGPLEIIEDGVSGLLVPPENPKLLSDKISFLVENKQISKAMGENARRRIEEKFSIERNVKDIEDVYLNLLK